jgi:LuxR family maltose regulon positive regulatory protein
VERLFLPTYRQARITTLQRWFRWLEEQGGIEGHPLVAVYACLLAATMGRPAEAERWADVVERWPYQGTTRSDDPFIGAVAALNRALLCRRGVKQMRADADEAASKFAAAGAVIPVVQVVQGIAQVLSGDLDGSEALFEDAIAVGDVSAPDVLAIALCERALLAMARGEWSRAEALAGQAREVARRTGIEDTLVCAVQARLLVHRGDAAAALRELVSAQQLRHLLTYALPHVAVQARIELTRVHLALGDVAGARTLMREIDGLLKRRPDLGTLAGEAQGLRTRLSQDRAPTVPGASSLTTAELRILPLLATHLSFPEIGAELFLSPHTIKSQAVSLYRKLGAASRSQAVARSRELGLLEGQTLLVRTGTVAVRLSPLRLERRLGRRR